MFQIREMDKLKDFDYWLETTFQSFKITYCEENNATEEEARKTFQDFYAKEKKAMDPNNPQYSIFIAESEKGENSGILWLQIRDDFDLIQESLAWIVNVFVEPHFRKQGLASKFIALAEDWSKEQGLSNLAFHVAKSNNVARRFYEHHGFEQIYSEGNSCFYNKKI